MTTIAQTLTAFRVPQLAHIIYKDVAISRRDASRDVYPFHRVRDSAHILKHCTALHSLSPESRGSQPLVTTANCN